ATPSVSSFLLGLIPTNPLNSMVTDNFLQIIVFSVFLGVTINMVGNKAQPVKEFIYSAAQVSFKMIETIIKLAPFGVFGYIAWIVGTQGLEILQSLAKLFVVVLLACLFQYIVFGIMIMVFTKMSPMPFYRKILLTQSIAFSTSSSKATLSTAMSQLQERMGVSKTNSNFLLPLGVCINMDGTAIYLGICALFFSQAYGIPLGLHEYLVLILTCTLGSIGAAGIPSGSIIFMGMVLSSVGLPIEGIGIILGIDRVLDMVRTTINITGDSAITLIVDHSEGTMNKEAYYSKKL
ncbi:MAG: dicarboxylate/amino acid:cation symporter, partial [Rickettsiales bacterium]|nr:dicarboxylate/amino acid:cation symporter [Rickettsiales bacterium]